jgi:hypothetical protein
MPDSVTDISFEQFQSLFTDAATKQFGSGWAFLVVNPAWHRLEIVSLPNQDRVLVHGTPALLCCDVWEHAYYLKYRNRRRNSGSIRTPNLGLGPQPRAQVNPAIGRLIDRFLCEL